MAHCGPRVPFRRDIKTKDLHHGTGNDRSDRKTEQEQQAEGTGRSAEGTGAIRNRRKS